MFNYIPPKKLNDCYGDYCRIQNERLILCHLDTYETVKNTLLYISFHWSWTKVLVMPEYSYQRPTDNLKQWYINIYLNYGFKLWPYLAKIFVQFIYKYLLSTYQIEIECGKLYNIPRNIKCNYVHWQSLKSSLISFSPFFYDEIM